jgi:uncharacterized protein YndB with AHSA1/START domain
MRTALIVLGSLATLLLLAVLAGYLFPRRHSATSSMALHQPPEVVWERVRDLGATADWWPAVDSMERVERADGREAWRQTSSFGSMLLVVEASDPPRRLVTRIDVPGDAAFGGTWTYEVTAEAGGSRVRITEDGFVSNPLFRLLANTVFGLHGTMDDYLAALGRRLGGEAVVEHGAA